MKDLKRRYLLAVAVIITLTLYLGGEYGFTLENVYSSQKSGSVSEEEDETPSEVTSLHDEINEPVAQGFSNKKRTNGVKLKNAFKPWRNFFVEMKDVNVSTQNVFFLETRCSTNKMAKLYKNNKGLKLNARQCCAVESTALMNPDRQVYVLHSCPLSDDFLLYSPPFAVWLLSYNNVHIVRLHSAEVMRHSPVQSLQERGLLETSAYPVEHTSDVLRLAVLWRFGGTYCDLDVVTIRSLDKLGTNWAGKQDTSVVANGVLNFSPGHRVLREALEQINTHYDGAGWSSNGPLLVTPIILRECNANSIEDAVHTCQGDFTVYDSPVLYPVHYSLAVDFFKDSLGPRIVAAAKTTSYSVHLWNKLSHEMVARVNSSQAYSLLAREFCPRVYHHCGTHF